MISSGAAQQHDILIVGILSFLGVLATALVTWSKLRSNKEVAKDIAVQVLDYLDTGNAHTAGQSLARLEFQVSDQSDRLDRVEVIGSETKQALDEHIQLNLDVRSTIDEHIEFVKTQSLDTSKALHEHIEFVKDHTEQ